MSAHAIPTQGPDSPYSFKLVSRGHHPLWFRGPLPIPSCVPGETFMQSRLRWKRLVVEKYYCGGGTILHPGGNPGGNLKSISHRCYPNLAAFVWDLTKETINLHLGYLQGGRDILAG